jgi:23S rRNA U2552 (ribose-2'-O)-methylase RlmE/FtsJ
MLAIIALQERALAFAQRLLKLNGYFLCKLFHGQEQFQEMRSHLASLFDVVHLVKPSASRDESPEMFLLAMGYRGIKETMADEQSNRTELDHILSEARRIRTKKKK